MARLIKLVRELPQRAVPLAGIRRQPVGSRCRRAAASGLLAIALVALSGCDDGLDDQAQQDNTDVGNPQQFQCVGRNAYSGTPTYPYEVTGLTHNNNIAETSFDPGSGVPVIVYGSVFFQLTPLLQSFIKRHECQHANFVTDEILANCGALVQMRAGGLSVAQEQQIAQWHYSMGSISPQYGGSGPAFWSLTLQCAGPR